MNDKDWEDHEEFWDDEVGQDDEGDHNGLDGDIDRNNDETFNDATEWNEDEHEEMIARDMILSNARQRVEPASRQGPIGSSSRSHLQELQQQAQDQLRLIREIRFERGKSGLPPLNMGQWNILHKQYEQMIDQREIQDDAAMINLTQDRPQPRLDCSSQRVVSTQTQPKVLTLDEIEGQLLKTSINLTDQEHNHDVWVPSKPQLQQRRVPNDTSMVNLIQNRTVQPESDHSPRRVVTLPKVLTVEELEQQLLKTSIDLTEQQPKQEVWALPKPNPEQSKRAGWSPFGGKDIFHSDRDRKENKNHRDNHKQLPEHHKYQQDHHKQHQDHHKQHQDHHKHHQDHHKHRHEQPKIIPPQVQLSVIEKAKRLHSITAMHSDEFLRDRIPTSSDGFRFVRHSKIANIRGNHNGVLTDRERDWLTRIQEKIQADYDDNIDQDYYYLLYFNRSAMRDEANQKPTGPGVFDRRFIPRERLLYNSGL